VCYSCRFDVEDGHMSMMCPFLEGKSPDGVDT
jgi:hypothetical protein